MQLKQLIATRVGLCEGLSEQTAGNQDIEAGSSFERFLDVRAGQRATWSFQVSAGDGDWLLGTSDVEFSANFYPLPDFAVPEPPTTSADSEEGEGQVLVPAMYATPATGRVEGTHIPERDGSIMLIWSNEHSSLRGKSIVWSLEVDKSEGGPSQLDLD